MATPDITALVDHLFRHKSGEIVATLTGIFGFDRIDLVEDVVQDTLVHALKHWAYHGIPDNPVGWIVTVARNRALDQLRREKKLGDESEEIAGRIRSRLSENSPAGYASEVVDDQLRLMFACCHPALSTEAQIALTLKTLGGFSVREIARAFVGQESTVAQRIVRAKRTLRSEFSFGGDDPFEVDPSQLADRLDSVMSVLYLMFNEGYNAYEGENLIRHDMVQESMRLTRMLSQHAVGDRPEMWALLALMAFHTARLPSRIDAEGNLVLLEDQDRKRWDRKMLGFGFSCLKKSTGGKELTAYHIEAGIASCHAAAPDYKKTNWRHILGLYGALLEIRKSPVITLNRAVAVAMVRGPESGLKELDSLEESQELSDYYLYHATRGDLLHRLGRDNDAGEAFRAALDLTNSEPEKRFLRKRIRQLQSSMN